MENMRVPLTAMDKEIQCKLTELYNKQKLKGKQQDAIQFVAPGYNQEQCTLLTISESAISIDQGLRQQMMEQLRNEEHYSDILQKLEDPNQMNEVQVSDRTYRIKRGILMIHERE